ncbi:hypothetical protein NKH77_41390 [Streptomyces sp. M19]
MEWFRPDGAVARPATVAVLGPADGAAVGSGVLLPATASSPARTSSTWRWAGPTWRAQTTRRRPSCGCWCAAPRARRTPHRPARGVDTAGPECAEGAVEWDGDLAVLDLLDGPSAAPRPPRWRAMAPGSRSTPGTAAGTPRPRRGRVLSCDDRIGYVDAASLTGVAIDHGYSGGPLWSGDLGAVVGLVAAALTRPRDPATGARCRTTRTMSPAAAGASLAADPGRTGARARRTSWPDWASRATGTAEATGARGRRGRRARGRDASADPVHRAFADVLGRVLADPARRAECARAVAERHGWAHRTDGSAPSVDEFARTLVRHERALAALTEVLYAADPRRGRTPRRGAAGGHPGCSPRRAHPAAGLPARAARRRRGPAAVGRTGGPAAGRAARRAARRGRLGRRRSGGARARIEALVAYLEGLLGDSRAVPEGTRACPACCASRRTPPP